MGIWQSPKSLPGRDYSRVDGDYQSDGIPEAGPNDPLTSGYQRRAMDDDISDQDDDNMFWSEPKETANTLKLRKGHEHDF